MDVVVDGIDKTRAVVLILYASSVEVRMKKNCTNGTIYNYGMSQNNIVANGSVWHTSSVSIQAHSSRYVALCFGVPAEP